MLHPCLLSGTPQKAIFDSCNFAWEKHYGQFRKDGLTPFIFHPLSVLARLRNWDIENIVALVAAPCHDVREDCDVEFDELVEAIGIEAASVVEELSFFPDPNDKRSNHVQKQDYMGTFLKKSVFALVIKMADRIENTEDFLNGKDKNYATKYWSKAKFLLNAVKSRQVEIEENFGKNTFEKIQFSCDDVFHKLRSV